MRCLLGVGGRCFPHRLPNPETQTCKTCQNLKKSDHCIFSSEHANCHVYPTCPYVACSLGPPCIMHTIWWLLLPPQPPLVFAYRPPPVWRAALGTKWPRQKNIQKMPKTPNNVNFHNKHVECLVHPICCMHIDVWDCNVVVGPCRFACMSAAGLGLLHVAQPLPPAAATATATPTSIHCSPSANICRRGQGLIGN